MILKKVSKDGKDVFIEITKEEAEEASKTGEFVIVVNDKGDSVTIDGQNEHIDIKIDRSKQEKDEDDEDDDEDEDDEKDEKETSFDFSSRFRKKFARGFPFNFAHLEGMHPFMNRTNDPQTAKLLRILPFMDEADIHEVIDKYLHDDPSFAKLNLTALMPFLSKEDCDAVFTKVLVTKELWHFIVSLAPFVSDEALSKLVDRYLEGEFPDLNLDNLYPFLNSKDIKRLFHSLMGK
jgi:hypothetical protein